MGVGLGLGEGVGVGVGVGGTVGGVATVVFTLDISEPGTATVKGLPLASNAWMDALFVTVAFTVSVIPTATVLPAGTLPSEQLTGTVFVQEPWLGIAESNVAAVSENTSVKFT